MLGASGDGKASEPVLGECVPGPATSSVAKEDTEQTAGEACLAPGTTQGALAQRLPCAQACRGGDAGSGLRPRAEVRSRGTPGHHKELRASSLPLPAQSWLPTLPVLHPTLALLCAVCLAVCVCRFVFQVSFPTPHSACAPIWGHAPLSFCRGTPHSSWLGLTLLEGPHVPLLTSPLSSHVWPLAGGCS